MKMYKCMPLGLALAASLIGVSSASAVSWDPQGTAVTGTLVSGTTSTLTAGATVTCSSADTSLTASGAVARSAGTTNPVTFSTCSNSLGVSPTTVTTTGEWSFTATSTTAVTATADNGSSPVADITVGSPPFLGCQISVTGPVTIPNNTWSNATHRLTINNTVGFTLDRTGICPGVNATGFLDGTFQLPSNVVIT